jgi:hypothetical protein
LLNQACGGCGISLPAGAAVSFPAASGPIRTDHRGQNETQSLFDTGHFAPYHPGGHVFFAASELRPYQFGIVYDGKHRGVGKSTGRDQSARFRSVFVVCGETVMRWFDNLSH